jgi:protein involved in polysaccharide export with SLBB domain
VSAGSRSSRQAGRAEHKDFDWSAATSGKKLPFAGRVIRIPLKELRAGNTNYNIVLRKGDVVHVPLAGFGYYYMMGNVNRPGAYQLGAIPVTLTRAIAGAGSLGMLAEPTKVDITRRIGEHKQQIVQVDLAKIFAGVQPDYYLKRDDIINVGTSPVSPWLAVLRNGFRATYGFGFVYDRNYADRDQFRPFELPNLLFW